MERCNANTGFWIHVIQLVLSSSHIKQECKKAKAKDKGQMAMWTLNASACCLQRTFISQGQIIL